MTQIHGSNHIRYTSSTLALRLTTDAPISYLAEEVPFVLEGPVSLILGPDERITAPIAATTREYFELTQETLAARLKLRGARSTSAFCSIWRKIGSSMGARCSSGFDASRRPRI